MWYHWGWPNWDWKIHNSVSHESLASVFFHIFFIWPVSTQWSRLGFLISKRTLEGKESRSSNTLQYTYLVSVCVCVYRCSNTSGCTYIFRYMYVQRPEVNVGCFVNHFLPFSIEAGSVTWTQSSPIQLIKLGGSLWGMPCLWLPRAVITNRPPCLTWFSCRCSGLEAQSAHLFNR